MKLKKYLLIKNFDTYYILTDYYKSLDNNGFMAYIGILAESNGYDKGVKFSIYKEQIKFTSDNLDEVKDYINLEIL